MKGFDRKEDSRVAYRLLFGYLVLINIAAFVAFMADKHLAVRGGRRIRNRTLLGLAFFGGSPGAYFGMYLFRHKNRQAIYALGIPIMIVAHSILFFTIADRLG